MTLTEMKDTEMFFIQYSSKQVLHNFVTGLATSTTIRIVKKF